MPHKTHEASSKCQSVVKATRFWFLLQQQLTGWTWINQFHLHCLLPFDLEENIWGQVVWFFWAGCLSCHPTNTVRAQMKT